MSDKLRVIKNRFVKTMIDTAEALDKKAFDVTRNEYIRHTVDNDVEGRLNKVELNLIGGFREAKKSYIKNIKVNGPKILVYDIETLPIEAYVWGLFDQTVGLNQIKQDWTIMSWAARWLHDGPDKVMYMDVFNQKNMRDDKKVVQELVKLMDEADILVGANSVSFDTKKVSARAILNGIKPPTSFKQYDTKRMGKRYFSFTSNKLEYMTHNLCTESKKLSHANFPGFSLWKEFLNKNKAAQKECEEYNIADVNSTAELFLKLLPWDNTIDWNVYMENLNYNVCTCGSVSFNKKGFYYTRTGKFQKYVCKNCGKETRDKQNLLSKDKRKSFKGKCDR